MRHYILLIVFLIFSLNSKSQNLKDCESIEINSKFKLEIVKIDSINYNYKLISKEQINQEISSSSASSLLDESLKTNEIQGVFAIGSFGNSKSILLVIKSGNDLPIDYKLFIDLKGKGKYKQTSTMPLFPNVPSIEMWPYNIYSLKILGFNKTETTISETIEEIDTICKSDYDIESGNRLIKEQLKLIYDVVSTCGDLEIDRIIEYEDSINSSRVSTWGWLDHPFIRSNKSARPLIFTLTECPYLERQVAYYYTKRKKDIKLVAIKWRQRRADGWQSKSYSEIERDLKSKHDQINDSFISIIGSPNDIQSKKDKYSINSTWQTEDGINVRTRIYIDMYSRSVTLHIFNEN